MGSIIHVGSSVSLQLPSSATVSSPINLREWRRRGGKESETKGRIDGRRRGGER